MELAQITYEDFAKVEMRVGRIIAVEPFPRARKPAWRLTIDFGEFGTRRSSAQITNYTEPQLLQRLVVAVANFPPRNIAGFHSQVLVLGAADTEGNIKLLSPDAGVTPGALIH
ncbi:MAG: tRNA-binding protein [Pseudomonadota bacterium]